MSLDIMKTAPGTRVKDVMATPWSGHVAHGTVVGVGNPTYDPADEPPRYVVVRWDGEDHDALEWSTDLVKTRAKKRRAPRPCCEYHSDAWLRRTR